MDDTKLKKDQQIPESSSEYDYLINTTFPSVSLPNQWDNLLLLNRDDTFRLVIYFYSMTGNPNKKLPNNWKEKGCTLENCMFRDNYENLIKLNALPLGISVQNVNDIKEMTTRLGIQYDVLSDSSLLLTKQLSLPTFLIENKIFVKKITIIVEKNIIKKVFYPIFSINKHIDDIIKWLKTN